ncbi:MAG: Rrf2 family transcriptional regulator [Planctomycetota bacterium]|nr:Rrf2 family transcriptional regulator [Planctomycetota bacterium]MDA1177562.1 Rrf2 family transcriptional regulator [Planctomycetota bacterium]
MKLTARAEYGCVAILELAARYESQQCVPVREIADRHAIPAPFLMHILLQLKAVGLVESTRGSAGGYRLTRTPKEISLWDVLSSLELTEPPSDHELTADTHDSVLAAVRAAWVKVHRKQRELLLQTNMQQLLEDSRISVEPMYHI